jgi:uncharacterized membrane protein YfhO
MSSILDMLNVRYVVFRGTPPAGVQSLYTDEDYWVYHNERALPRAFIPHRTQVIPDAQARLQAISAKTFDPRGMAYLEQSVDLPQEIEGAVEFVEDLPQRVILAADMQTAGLVVLADRWDRGWKAYVNETEVPILRVNHALRGVRVGSGENMIRFAYEPDSLYRGLVISAAGGIGLLAWMAGVVVIGFRRPDSGRHDISFPARTVAVTNASEPAILISPKIRAKKRR